MEERKNILISNEELKAICAMRMCLDPNPLTLEEKAAVHAFLERASKAFGYKDWIGAFHGENREV